ncbi:MAG TPA: lasso RiPP family leader peptide-containing protein [Thermoanaerobaculia bacterium]
MKTTKKAYQQPRLVVYGSVRELTREGGPNNRKDGGNNAQGNRT